MGGMEGGRHTKWPGSLEVIQCDRRHTRLPRRPLRGAREARPLCINISPLILVTSCLLHSEHPLLPWQSNGCSG